MSGMAKILVSEPDAANCELLDAVVRYLGHDPVHEATGVSVSAVVFEPADAAALAAAVAARAARPDVPLVCVSIRRPTEAVAALDPAAYLLKPFAIGALCDAIRAAVSARGRRSPS
jgi:DNA-binding response OmpR family regulator